MNDKKWNWQLVDWPDFTYQKDALEEYESVFQRQLGKLLGSFQHLGKGDKDYLKVLFLSESALKTSEIEGEFLNRDSLQSSIARHFGLKTDNRRVAPAEQGVADMMIDLYETHSQPFSKAMLLRWHRLLMQGKTNIGVVGDYRTHHEPMQVVSGNYAEPKVHYQAPPSERVDQEMKQFMRWLQVGSKKLPSLVRAGIAHWYFLCIHPFEDGNGRIGRAIAEKILSQTLKVPVLIALSQTIAQQKKAYYRSLKNNNHSNEITSWLTYFSKLVLAAVTNSQQQFDFIIAKTRLFDEYSGVLNIRQEKVINRIFREGVDGFKGGLSAENYIAITSASRATTTRDLADLVEKGVFSKTGKGKGTRYYVG